MPLKTLLLSTALLILPGFALAQAPAPATAAANPVIATVNGTEIRQSDLDAAEEDIGGASLRSMTPEQKRDYLTGFAVDLVLASKAAETRKLGDQPDFQKKLAYYRQKLLVETLLTEEAKTKVTEAEKQKIYNDEIKKISSEDEVRARHILVETEAEAKDIVAKLKGGADFAAIAKEKSKDPGSGAEGGDLGFFVKAQMVPEFSEAAFKLKPGETSEPVKTQFGYHIIRTEERRKKEPPAYEQVKGQIEEYLTRKVHTDLIQKLRADAKIEKVADSEKKDGGDKKPDAK